MPEYHYVLFFTCRLAAWPTDRPPARSLRLSSSLWDSSTTTTMNYSYRSSFELCLRVEIAFCCSLRFSTNRREKNWKGRTANEIIRTNGTTMHRTVRSDWIPRNELNSFFEFLFVFRCSSVFGFGLSADFILFALHTRARLLWKIADAFCQVKFNRNDKKWSEIYATSYDLVAPRWRSTPHPMRLDHRR